MSYKHEVRFSPHTYHILYRCDNCGALVAQEDQDLHDEWHESLGKVATDASWGAMAMRPIDPGFTVDPEHERKMTEQYNKVADEIISRIRGK